MLTGCFLAIALGLRHAVEPDHLAAVSTLVADRRGRRSVTTGLFWGIGHTLALVGVGLLLSILRQHASARFDDVLELGVAVMLLGLGARSLRRAFRAVPAHDHDEHPHAHDHETPSHLHVGALTLARAPLLVGLMHGLAGSGALTAMALASMPSIAWGISFLLCFGFGAMAGMALLAGAAGMLVGRALRTPRVDTALLVLAGALSLVLGLTRGWPLAVRLFAL